VPTTEAAQTLASGNEPRPDRADAISASPTGIQTPRGCCLLAAFSLLNCRSRLMLRYQSEARAEGAAAAPSEGHEVGCVHVVHYVRRILVAGDVIAGNADGPLVIVE